MKYEKPKIYTILEGAVVNLIPKKIKQKKRRKKMLKLKPCIAQPKGKSKTTREEILETAKKCVCGDREEDYGNPENNFCRIAYFWSIYKNIAFTSKDVAVMMALVKIARIASGHAKSDNWVDLAGYAACGGEMESEK